MISLTSPVETRAHEWPAGLKLGLLCIATAGLFAIESLPLQLGLLAVLLGLYALPGKLFFRTGLSRLRMLWPFFILIGIWHLIIGEWREGALILLRLVLAVGLANLVTMTTRLGDMSRFVEWLCRPLAPLGLPPERVALALALVVRFVPVLTDKAQMLMESWRARSRRRVSWRIILPFATLAIDDAERVAEALRARGGT
jgi:biotin transport system permease protein